MLEEEYLHPCSHEEAKAIRKKHEQAIRDLNLTPDQLTKLHDFVPDGFALEQEMAEIDRIGSEFMGSAEGEKRQFPE